MRLIFLFLFVLSQINLLGKENDFLDKPVSIQIENSRDYAILQEFLRRGFAEEEDYGYVLEGIKPISVRNFQAADSFLVPNYLDWELLVHEAIAIWKRLYSQKGNFIFKATQLPGSKPTACGFELQFINISRLKEVVEENIALFRYILGPFSTTQQIVERIAYSDELLSDVLKNNLTLMGIVLGFGLDNSLAGGKVEALSCNVLIRDEAPFIPQHRFFQGDANQKYLLSEEMYRFYYLEFAGGDDSSFRDKPEHIQPGLGFADLEEELKDIQSREEPLPIPLREESPRFLFAAFQGPNSNHALFQRLQRAQKWIQSLLKRKDFLEKVLEKIGGKKPTITCVKPSGLLNQLYVNREKEWSELLMRSAEKFSNGKERSEFIAAFCHPTEASRKRPWAIGVTEATLLGLKRAKINLARADKQFESFSKKHPQFDEIVKGLLYAKKSENSTGRQIKAETNRIRVKYVIENDQGEVLFANHDVWLHIRDTIAGFLHGVQSMRIGESRTLYVHPALAYGALTTLPICSSLVIKVSLLDIDDSTSCNKPLPTITPLDLSWINDGTLCEKIEESLHQIPCYIGSFYRDWLDKRGGLNMELLRSYLEARIAIANTIEEKRTTFSKNLF